MPTTFQSETAVAGCIDAIRRALELTEPLDDATYTFAPEGHGSVGEHLRHSIDHFDCFFRDIESGTINYDARSRSHEVEVNCAAARVVLDEILHGLERLSTRSLQRAIRIRQTAAPGEPPIEMESSIDRELVFLSGHMVHHLALMVLIAERTGASPSTELGVAYSTAAFRAGRTA